jgi:hypothetical protein
MGSDGLEGTLHLPRRSAGMANRAVPAARTTTKSAPNIRNVYYCGFSESALQPEFSKRRPVTAISYKNSLTGPVLVVPITTRAPPAIRGRSSWREIRRRARPVMSGWCTIIYTPRRARV